MLAFPVPVTKFEGYKSGHLFVTSEVKAKQITKMKNIKSPGVYGIPLKLLK